VTGRRVIWVWATFGAVVGAILGAFFAYTEESLSADCASCVGNWRLYVFGAQIAKGAGPSPWPDWFLIVAAGLLGAILASVIGLTVALVVRTSRAKPAPA